jgi:tetratricopeptide (TPR) repeat protein
MNKWTRPFEWNRASAAPAGSRPASAPRTRYFAFLSYSHQDAAIADWLHDELESFVVPSALTGKLTSNGVIPSRLSPIFRDRHELAASDDLGEEIEEALATSHCLIVLCSPAAAASRWTNDEIATFKRLHPDGCIIAAITSGEPFASDIPGRAADECLPPALRQKYDRRGRPTGRRAEPLAADLRDGGDGRRLGFLKIVAGMLDVGLDDLVQRDQLRRQRRLAWITAASLAAMLVAIVLAVTAINARDAARDQRREAEALVAFMLGDLKDKLEPIGRLDALDGVGAKVLEYYSKQDMSELSDSALLQRSRALSLSAQVAFLRGDLGSAEKLYREAMAGTGEAVRRGPNDPQRIYDHAQNIFWIGELARNQGQPRQAETAYREYKRLTDQLVALEPDNLKWRMEVLYGEENIGIVLSNQRRFAEAARQFAGALTPMASLASLDPDNSEYQYELGNMLAWAADSERDLGHIDAAIALRQRQLALLDRLIAADPGNADFRRQQIPAHQGLGLLLAWRGDLQKGIQQLRQAVDEADRLIPIEPDNIFWKGLAAQARLDLAKALVASGGSSAVSASELARGCDLARIAKWPQQQSTCLIIRSRLLLAAGDRSGAMTAAGRALSSALSDRSNSDPLKNRYSIAAAYRLVGDVSERSGDRQRAVAAWSQGLAQLPRGVAERPVEMDERAQLLSRLGRKAELRPITQRLSAMGYRSIS